ncbi:MAG: hypothetical protein JSU73_11900 [candidate division WOR-3 bacterium]|nr:MAG: hypothetical protein JSU73_11900 [candidate division WOR-3 bacterium]
MSRGVALLVGFLLAVSAVHGADADLSRTFAVKLGDWLAMELQSDLRLQDEMYDRFAPTGVYYADDGKVIVVQIFGERKTVEGARETMHRYETYIQTFYIGDVKESYGVDLKMSDFELVYYNRKAQGGPREIVRLTDGQLVVPTGTDR